MKQVSFKLVLLIVGLLPAICSAQYNPSKGASRIVLTSNFADKETHQAIRKVLSEEDLVIEPTADGYLIRSTQPLTPEGYWFTGMLGVQTGVIRLTGQMTLPEVKSSTSSMGKVVPVVYTQRSTSLQQKGFLYMDDLARRLQSVLHGSLTYEYLRDKI